LEPLLLLGALLGFIPIAIHLLNRSRYRVEPFGAMMFLRAAARVRAQRLKLQQWLLMATRVLFFILLAVALSRPITSSRHTGSGAQPTTHVVIIDGSVSMRQGQGEKNAFEQARLAATRVVDRMESYDNMLIIWGGNRPRPLFPTPSFDRAFLKQTIDALEPGFEQMDVAESFAQAFFGLQQSTLPRHRIYLFTDGQANGWELDDEVSWDRISRHRGLLPVTPGAYVLPQDAGAQHENLAPVSIRSRSPILDVFRQSVFVVEIANHSSETREARLVFTVDGTHETERDLQLPPGTTTAHFHHQFTTPGSHFVTATLEDDAFTPDNTLTRALHVLASIPVLIVEGKSAENPFSADGGLLAAALDATGEPGRDALFSVTRREHADTDTFDMSFLQQHRCIVLANVPTLSQQFAFLLEQYVEHGGGLLVTLGGRAIPESYSRLYKGGNGLLPGALDRHVVLDDKVTRPTFSAGTGSTILNVFDLSRTRVLSEVKVREYWHCTTSDDALTLAAFGESPFLLYKALGSGRVLMWTTSVSSEWTNFPFTQDYVPLLQNLVSYLSASVEPPVNLTQGEALLYSSERPQSGSRRAQAPASGAAEAPPECQLTLPDGSEHSLPLQVEGDEWIAQWSETLQPGLYAVAAPGVPVRHFAVSLAPAESDLSPASPGQQRQGAELTASEFVESYQEMSSLIAKEAGVREWWRVFVYILLCLLCVELLLAWRFST
jgi:hypothetical protein